MRGRWWGMAAVCVATTGCGSSGPFECAGDTQCMIGEAYGFCEANGYCSFRDPSCPSGRRYGSLAPSNIRQLCVPPVASTDSPTGGPVTTATAGATSTSTPSTNGSTSSTTQPITGPEIATAITTGSGDDTTTPTTGTGDTTTGPPPPCLSDEFDDGVFDPMWFVIEKENVEEVGGELHLTLSPPAGGFPGVRSSERDFNDAWMQVELGTPAATLGAQFHLSIDSDKGQTFAFIVHPAVLSLRRADPGEDLITLLEFPFDLADHRWLRFQVVDEVLSFQAAGDNGEWSTLLETDAAVDLSMTRMTLAATDWAEIPDAEVLTYRSFEYCDESLL